MKNYFQISHNKEKYTKPVYFHSHDFYEIYFFVDGNVKYYIENESYSLTKGDVLVIPPGKLHRAVIENNIPYERYVLWLYNGYTASSSGIKQYVEAVNQTIDEKHTRLASFKGDAFLKLKNLFDKLLLTFAASGELAYYTGESCNILILETILNALQQTRKTEEMESGIAGHVISYINQNITDTPSLDELSEQFFVSKYYLSRKFKEYTRMTIHQYILMKKVNLAKELLESGKTPQQVCSLCGFSTYSNFYKVFTKQTGISPKDYRLIPT